MIFPEQRSCAAPVVFITIPFKKFYQAIRIDYFAVICYNLTNHVWKNLQEA